MGLGKDLRGMSKEYLKNPRAQYWKYLDKILKLGRDQGVPAKDIQEHVKEYFEKKQ